MANEVTIAGIRDARKTVYRHLKPTALTEYPLLSRECGFSLYLKHENHNPTGAFKVRGGFNLLANLSQEERERGVITATRGNHGQSIALASGRYGVRCWIAVPEGNNPEKNAAMEGFGCELIVAGSDFDDARMRAEELQKVQGQRYIHSANEPHLVHGVGTYALEILEDLPRPDVILVPLGGGSGVCGVITAVRALSPGTQVIGVQSEKAASVYLSWKKGEMVTTDSADTLADGLATRVPFEMPFEIICRYIDDIVTVSDDEILGSIFRLFLQTHTLAEGAGAAAAAAAFKMRDRLKGKAVVAVVSGGNIETGLLRKVLNRFA